MLAYELSEQRRARCDYSKLFAIKFFLRSIMDELQQISLAYIEDGTPYDIAYRKELLCELAIWEDKEDEEMLSLGLTHKRKPFVYYEGDGVIQVPERRYKKGADSFRKLTDDNGVKWFGEGE